MQAFLMYKDYWEYISFLSNDEKSALLTALFEYTFTGEVTVPLAGTLQIVFTVIKNQINRDREKYEKRCDASRKNGSLGGRPKANEKESSFEEEDFFNAALESAKREYSDR